MDGKPAPLWALWRNPILVRYLRSRLRWKALVLNGVPTLIVTAFVFLVAYLAPQMEGQVDRVVAGRIAFLAVFVVQCIVVMLRGTFSVAAGVTREGIEGILEYQRLTPMPPLAKILGYVLGLPVRETVMFLLTVPFTLFAIRAGQVPWELTGKLYLVMASSCLLYHMTGFVAGIVVKKRFLAGFLSQLLMIGLYLVLPQLSRLGYVLFEYLTVRPLFFETLQELFPKIGQGRILGRTAEPFFETEIPLVWFTLLVQGFLFAVFLLVVYRRVRSEEEHLLGKFSAVPVLGGLLTILLGTALPGIEKGSLFPSMSASRLVRFGGFGSLSQPLEAEMLAIPGIFGLALLVVVLGVAFMITPSEDQRLKGLRLARKLGRRAPPWYSDAASSTPTTLICGALGGLVWMLFLTRLLDSRWYPDWSLGRDAWLFIPLAVIVPVLCFQLLLEVGGRAVWFFGMLFAWVVPPMAGIVLGLATQRMNEVVIYVISITGLSLPVNVVRVAFAGVGSTMSSGAYGFSLALHLAALAGLTAWALRKRAELRRRTSGETGGR